MNSANPLTILDHPALHPDFPRAPQPPKPTLTTLRSPHWTSGPSRETVEGLRDPLDLGRLADLRSGEGAGGPTGPWRVARGTCAEGPTPLGFSGWLGWTFLLGPSKYQVNCLVLFRKQNANKFGDQDLLGHWLHAHIWKEHNT